MQQIEFLNPYRPGAGHAPPHLAGRDRERAEFVRLLRQDTILENMILTGLRGVGKTVLMESLKPNATKEGWVWVGTDLSESTSVSEHAMSIRLCTDLSIVTSNLTIKGGEQRSIGFLGADAKTDQTLSFQTLIEIYQTTPGLVADKLRRVLEIAWDVIREYKVKGIIFAYDEAQNLSNQAGKEEYPLSLLLDTFQSLQRRDIPFMLVLTGLPTLFPKLVEARTFAERMFRIVYVDRLTPDESREAIVVPMRKGAAQFSDTSVDLIVNTSGGYPYFVQFICREAYDIILQQQLPQRSTWSIPIDEIMLKLDTDFFAGRWARATDRQRELLIVIATLDSCDSEFTVQEVVERSRTELDKPFSSSHVNQMLVALSGQGLVYKNRHGKYSFAVPLLGEFIDRQKHSTDSSGI